MMDPSIYDKIIADTNNIIRQTERLYKNKRKQQCNCRRHGGSDTFELCMATKEIGAMKLQLRRLRKRLESEQSILYDRIHNIRMEKWYADLSKIYTHRSSIKGSPSELSEKLPVPVGYTGLTDATDESDPDKATSVTGTYPDSYAGDFTYSGMPSQLDVRIPDGQLFECPVEVALALHHEQERDDLFYVPGFLEADSDFIQYPSSPSEEYTDTTESRSLRPFWLDHDIDSDYTDLAIDRPGH